jgi:hypothetical protein
MLILGSMMAWSSAPADSDAARHVRLAQASTPPAATHATAPTAPQASPNPIGSVATLQGSASVTRRTAASALKVKDSILKGDVLQTATNGTLGITFDDETTFTLTPNSRIAVDDFVYRERGARNSAVFNILRGTVAFVANAVAKTGDCPPSAPVRQIKRIEEGSVSGSS